MSSASETSPEVFISYSSKDKRYKDVLLKQLKVLAQQDIISTWHDGLIVAGQQWNAEIVEHLNSSRIILLLISPDFLTSDYVNKVELKLAAERHVRKEVCVIPVLVRNVNAWENQLFGELKLGDLQAVPSGKKFIIEWANRDKAFADVARGIQEAVEVLKESAPSVTPALLIPRPPIVGFVSRRDSEEQDIVGRLRDELSPQKLQLIALWGAGGVGKTTLAAEAARILAEDFDQRVVWVTADGRTDLPFTTFLDEIATQLGNEELRRLARAPKSEAVRALVASAPSLIVLDNFETISADERQQCLDFLQRVQCSALITTRQKLGHVRSVTIAGMSAGEATEFLGLLIEQTQDPSIFAIPYRKRLIETAEANPLIVEWIVGQIDLANDPEEVLTELVHGEGDAAHRVFNRSYNLPQLNDGGRAVLLALSLFTPSGGRPMLAGVAGMDLSKDKDKKRFKKAQQTLASLWLIKKTDAGLRLAVAGLTRELTGIRLAGDLREVVFHQRFVSRFVQFAERNIGLTREDFNALESEKDNLLNAAEIALAQKDFNSFFRLAFRLAAPKAGVLSVRGYWEQRFQLGNSALKVARLLQDDISIANWTYYVAIINHDLGFLDDAQRLHEESLAIEQKLGREEGISLVLHQLGWLAQQKGNLNEARRLYDGSLEINTKLGDQLGIANNLHHLGWLSQDQGDFPEARRLYNQALEILLRLDEEGGIASTTHQLGYLHLLEEDYQTAEELLQQSLATLKKLGHKQNYAECLESIGKLRTAQGLFADAKNLFAEAINIAKTLGDQLRIGSVEHSLGLLAEKQSNKSLALQLLESALSTYEKLASPKAAETRLDLARVKASLLESS